MKLVGHRGSGMNVMRSPADSRMRRFKEKSLLCFTAAASLSHLHFLEFDVQVTKDECPVIIHDNFILTTTQPLQGAIVERRVTDLTLDEFLSYGPQKPSGTPLFKKTKDGKAVGWIVEKDDGLCTLEDVFMNVDNESCGFDIKLKFDNLMVYEEQELTRLLQLILDVVRKCINNSHPLRPVIFSSFQPDAASARLMRQMQSTYPVFFITKGGTEMFKDPRRNSLEAAVEHCMDAGLQGIVSEVKAIFKNSGMVSNIKACELALFTYGQLNNIEEAVYSQHLMGIDAVIVDSVEHITEAVSRFTYESERSTTDGTPNKEQGNISEKQLAFLIKLMPELVHT